MDLVKWELLVRPCVTQQNHFPVSSVVWAHGTGQQGTVSPPGQVEIVCYNQPAGTRPLAASEAACRPTYLITI